MKPETLAGKLLRWLRTAQGIALLVLAAASLALVVWVSISYSRGDSSDSTFVQVVFPVLMLTHAFSLAIAGWSWIRHPNAYGKGALALAALLSIVLVPVSVIALLPLIVSILWLASWPGPKSKARSPSPGV